MRLWVLIFHFVMVTITPLSSLGQGLIPADREEYNKIPVYNGNSLDYTVSVPFMHDGELKYSTRTFTHTPSYDLTPYLPSPGQDCVALSIAYAVNSQAIARQRNTSSPKDPFSKPTPYGNGPAEWITSPVPQKAVLEAQNFKAIEHNRIDSLTSMKDSISSNLPVIIAVKVDRDFEDATNKRTYRFSGPPTGYHALVAVGYDDSSQRIKVMNSWGTVWKEGGYCWIAYDQFQDISSNHFCMEAYTLRLSDEALPRVIAFQID